MYYSYRMTSVTEPDIGLGRRRRKAPVRLSALAPALLT